MTDKIKETEVLEKHIIGENGISYTLGEDGLYYPDHPSSRRERIMKLADTEE